MSPIEATHKGRSCVKLEWGTCIKPIFGDLQTLSIILGQKKKGESFLQMATF
jgi:hypothetical protein